MTGIGIVLIGIAAFLLVVVALLAVPVSLSYRLSWRQALQGNVELHWLFGLVRVQLPLARSARPASRQPSGRWKKRKAKPAAARSNPFAAIRQKAFRERVLRFMRDIWRAVHKQNLVLRVRIGLGDPADTGRLWAVMGPVSGMFATAQDASIEIEPEFIDAVFELDSSGNIRVLPLQMLYLMAGLLISPSFWHGIRKLR